MSKIKEINIYSQTRTRRTLVGKFWREGKKYFFEYNKAYKKLKNAIALGPEFPLWKGKISSTNLFSTFLDRIPSKNNPAYKDYCKQWGINENEKDIFILLTTIGRRGPSTFIFEPALKNEYTSSQLKKFRTRLDLSQYEFEALFDISHMTFSRLELGKLKNDFYLRYFELFDNVPEALDWILKKRGQLLHDEKRVRYFSKKEIIIELGQNPDETYISRSQAKRVLFGLEKFSHIILNFKRVETVGQGFVDEIFRVYKNFHPEKTISYINANPEVTFMIKRNS